jgi:hypothetical protein
MIRNQSSLHKTAAKLLALGFNPEPGPNFKVCANLKVLGLDRAITSSDVAKITIGKINFNLSELI